jgi:acetaldehyde dehydrogenase (acetylating)
VSDDGRIPVAIIGSGNIGTDLLFKLHRSEVLQPILVAGIDPYSEGLALARDMGVKTTSDGIDGLLREAPDVVLAFDATSAKAHVRHARVLAEAGITAIDLTPAARGPYVVPPVNLGEHLDAGNVNLVSCGGQATIPIVAAAARVSPVDYAEIVSTIASRSAGPGTRQNIDEFTETTAAGLVRVGGARSGKAIIILNPAEPPIMMVNTVHMRVPGASDQRDALRDSILAMVAEVAGYVPGYRLRADPVFDGDRVSVFLEVAGAGDYLPRYAGNLDIMTAAAVATGERLARHLTATSVATAASAASAAPAVPA